MNNWECEQCKKEFSKYKPSHQKYCSRQCYYNSMKGVKGDKTRGWKDTVKKSAVHKWLDIYYGKPKECEMDGCVGKSNVYEWCLKTDKKYIKNRNSFLRLCRSCHRKYDWTPEKQKQAIKNLSWNTNKIRISKYGKKYKEKSNKYVV